MWSPYPAEARLLLAVVMTHQGRLDEAWSLLDVTGQDPPMVYEWLYFAHQMLITIGIRGDTHSLALERLRDYWRSDGLTAIGAGSAELMRAAAAGDPPGRSRSTTTSSPPSCPFGTTGSRRGSGSPPSSSDPATAAAHQSADERAAAADVERCSPTPPG